MKKLLGFLCAVMMVFGTAGVAGALNFTLDSYNVTLNDTDPGLALYWNPILTTPASADFEVGDSVTFALFELGTYETWSNTDDKVENDITVDFNFSSPNVNEIGSGQTVGNTFFWILSWGEVAWNNPIEFSFGDTGLFTIELEDDSFWTPGSTTIDATLTYVNADTPAPVPEPSTILLVGTGLLGIIGFSRKRLNKKA